MVEQVEVGEEEFGFEQDFQICSVGPSVPAVGDVASVHDLSKDVFEILPGHKVVLAEIVVQHICADGQVTIVEGVDSAPALGAEFLAAHHQGVEVAEGEETGLELVGLFIAFLDESLVEVGVGSSQVGLQILRGFVGNLD